MSEVMPMRAATVVDEIAAYWYEDGHLNADQRDFFIGLLGRLRPSSCLEIGFASGRSAVTTLVAARPDLLVSVDLSLDYIPGARAHAARLRQRFPNLKIVEGDSRKVLGATFFTTHFPRGVDYAFVDGDHSYEGCCADLEAILPHLSPGGLIVVDDYRSGPPNGVSIRSVTRAVDDFVLARGLAVECWRAHGKGVAVIRRPASLVDRGRSASGIVARILWRHAGRALSAGNRRLAGRLRLHAPLLVRAAAGLKVPHQGRHLLRYMRSRSRRYLLETPSPWLTFDAIEFLRRSVRTGTRVFEYGSGGSTLFWLRAGVTCVSVEHDPRWYETVRSRAGGSPRLDYRLIEPEMAEVPHADPANPDDYVSGSADFRGQRFYRYAAEIEKFPDASFDIVLIDGRARPSCIKHGAAKVRPGGCLVVDNAERAYYFTLTAPYLEGFEKTAYEGLGPVNEHRWTTAVYVRRR